MTQKIASIHIKMNRAFRPAAFSLVVLLLASPSAAQAPPADDGYPSTGPLSGYMDFHFNKADGEDGVLDFHRFVLLLSHAFSPRLRFVGELELEHAFVEGLEESGELELEQAYIDFLLSRRVNVRAGMLLMPVGIINERHEPPVFNGVERPFVDTVIVPTHLVRRRRRACTARSAAASATAPTSSRRSTPSSSRADEGIRGGRQKGSEANVRNVAFTGRVEYLGVRGLTLGASIWTGESSFAAPRLDTTVRVGEVDARYRRDRLELRGQFAAGRHRRRRRG